MPTLARLPADCDSLAPMRPRRTTSDSPLADDSRCRRTTFAMHPRRTSSDAQTGTSCTRLASLTILHRSVPLSIISDFSSTCPRGKSTSTSWTTWDQQLYIAHHPLISLSTCRRRRRGRMRGASWFKSGREGLRRRE